jgi:hypothetical protein
VAATADPTIEVETAATTNGADVSEVFTISPNREGLRA